MPPPGFPGGPPPGMQHSLIARAPPSRVFAALKCLGGSFVRVRARERLRVLACACMHVELSRRVGAGMPPGRGMPPQ